MPRDKEHLTKEIIRLRKVIKEKFQRFKTGNLETEKSLEKQYKPLIKEIRRKNKKDIKEEVKDEEEEVKDETTEQSEESEDEDLNNTISNFVAARYTHPLTKEYLMKLYTEKNKLDNTYGPHMDEEGISLMMGNARLDFEDDGMIKVKGVLYKGTRGLYELVFMKLPDEEKYNENDLTAYKEMLNKTSAHKRRYDFKQNINRIPSFKYRKVIVKLFPPKKTITGSGWKSSKHRDISYWDNPNELCDRLRLLVVSAETGNTSHKNEIMNIIEELKEAKYILGSGNAKYKSLLQ